MCPTTNDTYADYFAKGESKRNFGNKTYVLGDASSLTGYPPDSPRGKYILNQPYNGCVASSIINGAIKNDTHSISPDLQLDLYHKLKTMPYGRDNWRVGKEFFKDGEMAPGKDFP